MVDALWYLSRGTGVVSLVLLTVVVALGVGTRAGRPVFGLPRFAVGLLHRNAALMAVTLLAVHVVSILFDPYAQLRLVDVVVPFTAAYRPLWLGLGTLACELVVALIVTSVVRHRLGRRTWRAVHWLAYAAWPVASLHALGTGTDRGATWLQTVAGICAAAVAAAVAWRVGERPRARRAASGSGRRGKHPLWSRSVSVSVRPSTDPAVTAPAGRNRLLGPGATDLANHLRRHGPLPRFESRGRVIAEVADAGLTGRGGAGFPTDRKMAEVAAGRNAVVVANGAEGEPASAKDRTLLAYAPHLVLDGLQLAADAVAARHAHIYLRPSAVAGIHAALAERRAGRWDRLPVVVHAAPDRFVSGEESAVVAAVSGRQAVPADRLRRVSEVGVHGAPTLVQNVETLAHLGLIARYGAAWFRRQGTTDEPGTFLATVGGAVVAPGVYEVPYGIPLGEAIALAGGPTAPLRAVLVGGFHGGWVPPAPDLPVSRAGLARYDAAPGAGVMIALDATTCGLAEAARIVGYLAAESAGQCGPCLNGLPRLAEMLAALARPRCDSRLPAEIDRLAALVTGRGACRHPDGTGRLARSTVRAFADDVTAHLNGRCVARCAR